MHRILVEEKSWISESRFLHALNYCMLLPGPEAQQLATYIGWLLHGTRGGLVAGGAVRPAGLRRHPGAELRLRRLSATSAWSTALFFGLKAGGARDRRRGGGADRQAGAEEPASWSRSPRLAFVAIFFFDVPFPLIILAARRRSADRRARLGPSCFRDQAAWRAAARRRVDRRRHARRSAQPTMRAPAAARAASARSGWRCGSRRSRRSCGRFGADSVFHQDRAVLQPDGGGHLRRRLCRARLRRAAGGRALSAGCSRARCSTASAWPRPRPAR